MILLFIVTGIIYVMYGWWIIAYIYYSKYGYIAAIAHSASRIKMLEASRAATIS